MKKIQELSKEIEHTTLKVQQEYPEMNEYLDDNPTPKVNSKDPEIKIKKLSNWLVTLKQLLKHRYW